MDKVTHFYNMAALHPVNGAAHAEYVRRAQAALESERKAAQSALTIARDLVRRWQCTEGTSACDLLDECTNAVRDAGLVTPTEIDAWIAADDAALEE